MRHALLLLAGLPLMLAAQQSHTIVATDFEFTPELLHIAPADTVWIHLNPGHSFREVTGSAWIDNETTPVGAFDFGPFDVTDSSHFLVLTSPHDTLYYICVPHASMGMKGRIVVDDAPIGFAEQPVTTLRLVPSGHDLRLWDAAPGMLARAVDLNGRNHPLLVEGTLLRTDGLVPGLYVVEVTHANGDPLLVQRVVLE